MSIAERLTWAAIYTAACAGLTAMFVTTLVSSML